MKILANDGISKSGIDNLTENGFEIITTNVAQEQLINFINENNIDLLINIIIDSGYKIEYNMMKLFNKNEKKDVFCFISK